MIGYGLIWYEIQWVRILLGRWKKARAWPKIVPSSYAWKSIEGFHIKTYQYKYMNRIKLVLWLLCIARTGGDCHTIWGHTAGLILTVDREGWWHCAPSVFEEFHAPRHPMSVPTTRLKLCSLKTCWSQRQIASGNGKDSWSFLPPVVSTFIDPKATKKLERIIASTPRLEEREIKTTGEDMISTEIHQIRPTLVLRASLRDIIQWIACPCVLCSAVSIGDLRICSQKEFQHSQPSVVAEEHHSGKHGIEEGIRQAWANRKLWMAEPVWAKQTSWIWFHIQ